MNDKEYNEELELTNAEIGEKAEDSAVEEAVTAATEAEDAVSDDDGADIPLANESDEPYTLFPMEEVGVFDENYVTFTEDEEPIAETVTEDDCDPAPLSNEEDEESEDMPEEEEDRDGEEYEEEEAEEDTPKSEQASDGNNVKPRRVDSIFDFIEICIFTLAGVFILMSFFFRYSIVDGGSMKNTLQHGERLILSSFLYTPECGDIVVVQDKSSSLKDPIVKRIIAVEGQTVKFTRTEVYVDGVKLDEPYVYTGDYVNNFGASDEYRYSVYPSDELLPYVVDSVDGVYYEVLVPDGEIFVMGDHRNNSKDSREIGMLHEDAIIGKAVFRFYPFSKFGKIE